MIEAGQEASIRAAAALRMAAFKDWAGAEPRSDSFGEIPWLEIVTAASLALLTIDKHLKAANEVIDRLAKLYKWAVDKKDADDAAPATLGERIIVLLADERARYGDGLTVAEIATRTMVPSAKVQDEIERLSTLRIAFAADDHWTLRTESDG